MSLSAQAKVLRVLQESMISRAEKDIKVDVRVIAATNKDLKTEIAEGRFREDLYHRLAVILIKVPSLNERREDIQLISHFADKIASEQGNAVKKFSSGQIIARIRLDWKYS
jgi:DNA-binding NtrC family response regulator